MGYKLSKTLEFANRWNLLAVLVLDGTDPKF
jgi:hypothetical protein